MKCLIHVYLKSLGSDKFSDIWHDMERILEKRWRQVLSADALIQLPHKTPERNPRSNAQTNTVILVMKLMIANKRQSNLITQGLLL